MAEETEISTPEVEAVETTSSDEVNHLPPTLSPQGRGRKINHPAPKSEISTLPQGDGGLLA